MLAKEELFDYTDYCMEEAADRSEAKKIAAFQSQSCAWIGYRKPEI